MNLQKYCWASFLGAPHPPSLFLWVRLRPLPLRSRRLWNLTFAVVLFLHMLLPLPTVVSCAAVHTDGHIFQYHSSHLYWLLLPCEAMLVLYMLWPCVLSSICPSFTSRSSIEIAGRTELIFGMGASFDQSFSVFKEIHISTKNNDTSLCKLRT